MSARPLRTTAIDNPATMGQRIRYARIRCEMSQQQLADRIKKVGGSNVTKSLVGQWERDSIKNPTNDNLFAIEASTGFSAQWLATGRGEKKAKVTTAQSLNPLAVERALAAAIPSATPQQAQVFSSLYDVLIDTPDISDKTLSSIAGAISRRI